MSSQTQSQKEIEVRFLEVNEEELKNKLRELGAEDFGPDALDEIVFYDQELKWRDVERQYVRIRRTNKGIRLTFKNQKVSGVDGTEEVEFEVGSFELARTFLKKIGLVDFRYQQKKRHSFKLGEVMVEFDTWPKIPTFVELEGPSEQHLKETALLLGLEWHAANTTNARDVIEKIYNIPVGTFRYFTFDRVE